MAGLDAETIESLISCEKHITEPPRKESQLKNRSFRNDMKVASIDMKHAFSVFLRQSDDFPEDFSIGLNHVDENGKIYTLMRCNDHMAQASRII